MSGLAHVFGDYWADPSYVGKSYMFFIYQAVYITVEDFIIAIGKKIGIHNRWWVRITGYTFTYTFLVLSNIYFGGWSIAYGLGDQRMFQQSVVRPALGYVANGTGFDVRTWIAERCVL